MGVIFGKAVKRVTGMFGQFTPAQKAMSIAAVLALLVGGFFLYSWASKPTYAQLFTSMSAADASAIVEDLNAAGVPNELADGGSTIMVPRDQVDTERVRLAGKGLPAGDTTTGYPLLDKQGITTSEFQQQVGYQRALEGELAKTIKAINGVNSAVVHLAIPKKDVFADKTGQPTASVLVSTEQGKDLSADQVQAVVNLVAASVEGLDPKQVTVADASGKVLTGSNDSGGAAGDQRNKQTQDYQTRLASAIQQQLERVVGPGNAVVTVTADLDYDTTTKRSRTYTNSGAKPLAESATSETYTGEGAGRTAVGVLGPDNAANVDRTTGGTGTGANGTTPVSPNKYEKKSSQLQNPNNQVDEERVAAPGTVRTQGIAVLINSKAAPGVDPMELERLVTSAGNINKTRGDQITISSMPFDQSAAEQAQKALDEAAAAEKKAGLMKIARTAALLLVIFLMLVVAIFGGRKRAKQAAALRRAELEMMQRRMTELEIERMKALEGTRLELEAAETETGRLAQVRDEVGELVDQQPDEVAQLLRGWLADRRA